ncbi:hypothetical protein [Paenibacillus tianjinensis]|uniref:Uncharacterized protein n=1 Tax=Paenibacillus tianjinensis TaxID=2810347 RepID=A0ABX7L8E7_9BACL|nr:hypothetical protein [Paenibacillus tianjinensis]QSF42685.1 hypothetical protein JRJ22_15325 [Paenibacillus tianjinensis]
MSWYDEEFYREPSEFEEQIDALKESLMNAIKDEHKAELDKLRKENAELEVIKRDFAQIKEDYRAKERGLELKMKEAQTEARRTRLSALLESFGVTLFQAKRTSILGSKCDKCDDNRQIHYSTPSGKPAQEYCECRVYSILYVPEERICCEFKIERGGQKMKAWYDVMPSKHDDEDYGSYRSSTHLDALYEDGMSFEKLKQHGTFFKEKADCQRYCDWLNEQEANKAKEG